MSQEVKNAQSSNAELHVKKLQLHWLLQITKAINYNIPSPQLFQIYENVMMEQLKVSRLMLFIHEQKWHQMLSYGILPEAIPDNIDEKLNELSSTQLGHLSMPEWVKGFDSIIPVNHNEKPLAYAFIGDIQHEEIVNLKEVLPFIHTITNIIVVAIENKRLSRETIRQAQLEKELELAARMQNMLFPTHLPDNHKIDVAATYLPHQQVGGDYYDYIEVSRNELLICMADVSGKGISAALLMSNFQANLNARATHFTDLRELVRDLNASVNKSAKGEKFITVFLAVVNTENGMVRYINAGHNHPFIYDKGSFIALDKGTTGLGMFEELPFIHEGMAVLNPSAVLFCYTDGIVEQENDQGEEYGLDKLMKQIEINQDVFTMKDLHFRILDDFQGFRKSTDSLDDVTLLSCRLITG